MSYLLAATMLVGTANMTYATEGEVNNAVDIEAGLLAEFTFEDETITTTTTEFTNETGNQTVPNGILVGGGADSVCVTKGTDLGNSLEFKDTTVARFMRIVGNGSNFNFSNQSYSISMWYKGLGSSAGNNTGENVTGANHGVDYALLVHPIDHDATNSATNIANAAGRPMLGVGNGAGNYPKGRFYTFFGGTNVYDQKSYDNNIDLSKWQHITCTWNAAENEMVVYYNGEEHTNTIKPGSPIAQDSDLLIGGHKLGNANKFCGYIDEIRIYEGVVSATKAEAIYKEKAVVFEISKLNAKIAEAEEVYNNNDTLPDDSAVAGALKQAIDDAKEMVSNTSSSYDAVTGMIDRLNTAIEDYQNSVSVIATSYTMANKEDSITTIEGGGVYTYGDTVTLTAKGKPGFKFLGWYAETDLEDGTATTNLSSKFAYTFDLTRESAISYVALYEGEGKVNLTVEGDATIQGESAQSISALVGTSVTVKYTGEEKNFLYWKNASGKKVSADATYTFSLISDVNLIPVVKGTAGTSVLVEFVNSFEQVLSVSTWTTDTKVMSAVEPYQLGYKFNGWKIKGTLDTDILTDAAAIWTAISNKTDVTLVPVFAKVETEECTVTYSLDGSEPTLTATKKMGDHMTLSAAEDTEKVFQYWTDENGNILSYSKTYTFQVTKDITVKAKFDEKEIEAKPTIGITGQYPITDSGNNVVKVAFAATRDVPEDYTLIEHGMLYTRDNTDESLFVEGADNVYKCTASKKQPQGTLTINIPVQNATTNIKAKAYVIVQKDGSEDYITYYSNVAVYEIN